MTTATPLSPDCVLDALRGDRATRPPRDTTSAGDLRARLELGVAEVLGAAEADPPVVITARRLRPTSHGTDLHESARGRLRGALVAVLARLHAVGAPVGHAYDDALAAWRAEGPPGDLAAHFDSLDADDRARLATDVTANHVTLVRALGEVPATWNVRTNQRASLRLAQGRVLLRDAVDLVIGSIHRDVAGVVLLDLTTAPLGEGAERALRYHALVEALRTSVLPLRCAALSTATGELWLRDVDDELLARAADDVLGAVLEAWRAR